MVKLLFFVFLLFPLSVMAEPRIFSHFSVNLPDGWDGDEQKGFISDNPDEYLLSLGKKDETGDAFIAQVSIYLLPNKPGVDTRNAANTLAEAQADATPPRQSGNFMVFEGEPRTRAMKGRAKTFVKATPERLLIIIAQDPENAGSEEIIASLKGESAIGRSMLGK